MINDEAVKVFKHENKQKDFIFWMKLTIIWIINRKIFHNGNLNENKLGHCFNKLNCEMKLLMTLNYSYS